MSWDQIVACFLFVFTILTIICHYFYELGIRHTEKRWADIVIKVDYYRKETDQLMSEAVEKLKLSQDDWLNKYLTLYEYCFPEKKKKEWNKKLTASTKHHT